MSQLLSLSAGAVLLCALALPLARHPTVMLAIGRAQSLALAAAACFAGGIRHAPQLYLAGGVVLALNVVLPAALPRRAMRPAETATGVPPAVAAACGVAIIGVAAIAVPRGLAPPGAALALPLGALLLATLQLITRRGGLAPGAGVLSMGNAVLLAAIMLPGLPLVPQFAAALAALPLTVWWLSPRTALSGPAESE